MYCVGFLYFTEITYKLPYYKFIGIFVAERFILADLYLAIGKAANNTLFHDTSTKLNRKKNY